MAIKNVVVPSNLGRGLDIGIAVPAKITVKIGAGLSYDVTNAIQATAFVPLVPPVPAPTIAYLSGNGSAANLTGATTTLVKATPYSLSYVITANWNLGNGGPNSRFSINNVVPSTIGSLSFTAVRIGDLRAADEHGIYNLRFITYRNNLSGAGAAGPITFTVFLTVYP